MEPPSPAAWPGARSAAEDSSSSVSSMTSSEDELSTSASIITRNCTVCFANIASAADVFEHPTLHVLLCATCHEQVSAAVALFGADGSEDLCTWCGDGGDLLLCDHCPRAFCDACITQSLGVQYCSAAMSAPDWECVVCDPSLLDAQRRFLTDTREQLALQADGLADNTIFVAEDVDDDVGRQRLIDRLVAVEAELEEAANSLEDEATQRIRRELVAEMQTLAPKSGSTDIEAAADAELRTYIDLWTEKHDALADAAAELRDQCDAAGIDLALFYRCWDPKAKALATTTALQRTSRLGAPSSAEVRTALDVAICLICFRRR